MADKKISQLTNASTPLAGTEVLPIVQSGSTVKVASDDLTVKNVRSNATTGILQIAGPAAAATRTMTVPDANFTVARTDAANSFTADQTLATGNLVVGTAAKGIDFSANTHAAGMTSELLNWYEEGTWTPELVGTGTLTTVTTVGNYTRIGRLVTATAEIDVSDWGTFSALSYIQGLPFNANASAARSCVVFKETFATGLTGTGRAVNPNRIDSISYYDNSTIVAAARRIFFFTITYFV